MYTISRGPSKLMTRRRTGPTQQIDNKVGDSKRRTSYWPLTSSPAPKLVFHSLNGKPQPAPGPPLGHAHEENFTAAHEENVKFVNEAWQEVKQQLGNSEQLERGLGPVQYTEKNPNPSMKNFVPIDLEEWWAQRFLANIAELA
ncbi:protein FAM195A-like [Arapaima gigas]